MIPLGEVAVIGDVFCDVILRGIKRMPEWGEEVFGDEPVMCPGGAANVAIGLASLGVPTRLFVRTHAPDTIGDILAAELAKHDNLTVRYLHEAPSTALTVALPMGTERALISYAPPATVPVSPALEWKELRRVSHVHLAEWTEPEGRLGDHLAILEDARARGITTSLDISWRREPGRAARVRDLLELVNLFLPNQTEACQVAQCDDPEKALRRLSEIVPTVVVKLGAAGAIAASDGQIARVAGQVIAPVDTTGAGDAFASGFIYGYLRRWSLPRCLALANVCGAIAVGRIGSSVAVPSRREAFAALELSLGHAGAGPGGAQVTPVSDGMEVQMRGAQVTAVGSEGRSTECGD